MKLSHREKHTVDLDVKPMTRQNTPAVSC